MEKVKVALGFDRFPRKYTGEGENISPPISIDGAKGRSMAIVVDDPDCPTGTWVHWVIWNMPVVPLVPEAIEKRPHIERPFMAVQGTNSGDEIGYDGPLPPRGHGPHRYYFKVYVLDSEIDLEAGATKEDLMRAIRGRTIQQGETMATYERR
ncbi:MAG: YbhB/YbcL family Raf kinase inhibitor-like protein [Methanomassiliicoccales archaeon]|nr:MAG: YbhB/YbcL family Raf kinase inhibitor-like protein [Methanomassiliicoccales archaeon]